MASSQSPETSWFQRRSLRKIRANAKKRLNKFKSLKALTAETKHNLRRAARHYEIQLGAVDVYKDTISRFQRILVAPLAMLLTLGSTYLFIFYIPSSDKDASRLATRYIFLEALFGWMMLTSIIALPMLLLAIMFSERTRQFIAYSKILSSWLIAGIIIYGVLLSRLFFQLSPDSKLEAAGLVGAIVYILTLFFVRFISTSIEGLVSRRARDMYPDAVIIDGFLNLLSTVQKEPARWVEVKFKQKLIKEIESTAICIEYHLPRYLRTGNLVTDNWLRERSEQIAAGVRSLIKWVYTPQLNTREEFMTRVAAYFTYAARGDWDSFDRIEPEKLSRPELLRTKAKLILNALISAAVPLVVLLFVKRLDVTGEPVLSYLTVGAYIWAALSLLSNIDPNYSAKLAAIKDVSQLLPFGKKGKEQ